MFIDYFIHNFQHLEATKSIDKWIKKLWALADMTQLVGC